MLPRTWWWHLSAEQASASRAQGVYVSFGVCGEWVLVRVHRGGALRLQRRQSGGVSDVKNRSRSISRRRRLGSRAPLSGLRHRAHRWTAGHEIENAEASSSSLHDLEHAIALTNKEAADAQPDASRPPRPTSGRLSKNTGRQMASSSLKEGLPAHHLRHPPPYPSRARCRWRA